MRTGLKLCALSLAFLSLGFWFFGGPNLGWTKTTHTEWRFDPITESEYPEVINRFLPGIDFLAAAGAVSVLLFGISFFFRKKTASPSMTTP